MTTDIMINNVIENICQRFGVAATEIVPRMQAYGMAMNLLGIVISGFFFLLTVGITIFAVRLTIRNNTCDDGTCNADMGDFFFAGVVPAMVSVFPLIIMIVNTVEYVGWKYAPEIKAVEFAAHMLKGG